MSHLQKSSSKSAYERVESSSLAVYISPVPVFVVADRERYSTRHKHIYWPFVREQNDFKRIFYESDYKIPTAKGQSLWQNAEHEIG